MPHNPATYKEANQSDLGRYKIDLAIAEEFLGALGYSSRDSIKFNTFFPKGHWNPKKHGHKLPGPLRHRRESLERDQHEGKGVYFAVNDGYTKEEIETCRAFFIEHDDLPKEESANLWRQIGLPEPTIQVDTGGRSIHSYWVLDEPTTDIPAWERCQADLVAMTGADKQIKNCNRLMRLAGAWHITAELNCNQSIIYSHSGNKYSFDELRAVIKPPIAEPKIPQTEAYVPPTPYPANQCPPIPLERCVSKTTRERLANGSVDGEKNSHGLAVAADLIGTARRLRELGIEFQGDPRAIFDVYADLSGAVDKSDDRWNFYEDKPDCKPSCPDEALLNCVAKWQREHQPVAEYQQPKKKGLEIPEGFEGGRPHFWSTPEAGLNWESFKFDPVSGGMVRSLTRIGDHLSGVAYVNNPEKNGSAIWIEFKDLRGQLDNWLLPRRGVIGDTGLLNELYAKGYWFDLDHKKLFVKYLAGLGADIDQVFTISDRTGWIDKSFVLPNKSYGDQSLKFRDIEPAKDTAFKTKGTLEDWITNVAALAANNSRLIFALGVAFASPLAPLLDMEPGGFHLYGATSQGKTSALRMAASVGFEPARGIRQWRSTTNALEAIAQEHNHLLLPLDEIGQADPREVGNVAYMLGNGQGKARSSKTGKNQPTKTWHLQFLSNGETRLSDYLKTAGISIKGGQEVRMLDLPACPSDGFGVLESHTGFANPVSYIDAINTNSQKYCGTALDAFLTHLVEQNSGDDSDRWLSVAKDRLEAISKGLKKDAPKDEVIGRVSKKFALIQLALELAHSYGLLPFPIDQVSWAIAQMFTDWLGARGGAGSLEVKNALERIKLLFVQNQHNSDRIYRIGNTETDQPVRNLLAYRKLDEFDQDFEYWVPNAIFNAEIVKDCDRNALIQEMQGLGWLKPPGADGKPYLGRRVNGKVIKVFVLHHSGIFKKQR
ncbi:MAG: DUF927 domain-containing protein [Pseudanabaenaceae cyanobacterium bins.68]|nr:DUF927 domain-containing protein [Pseudanabaenaceae cyanobacterium bins.68]